MFSRIRVTAHACGAESAEKVSWQPEYCSTVAHLVHWREKSKFIRDLVNKLVCCVAFGVGILKCFDCCIDQLLHLVLGICQQNVVDQAGSKFVR